LSALKLSPKTRQIIHKMFPPRQHAPIERALIDECGINLPWHENSDEWELERVRFAVLKLSAGDAEKLSREIRGAQTDWRDTLMAAGFGHSVTQHLTWADQYLATTQTS